MYTVELKLLILQRINKNITARSTENSSNYGVNINSVYMNILL